MDGSTTLTIRLPPKVKKELSRLAQATDRTKSWLAGQAVADYVAREAEIAIELKRRVERVRSGKVKLIPHEEVMAMMRAKINKIARRKR